MGTAAVVIAKSLDQAKGRLAELLSLEERRGLAATMAGQVLGVVADCGVFPTRIFVSPDEDLLTIADGLGFRVVREDDPRGMNGAFERGLGTLGRDWAAILLPADLPLLQTRDLKLLHGYLALEGGVVLVPSPGGGTSLLGLPSSHSIPLHFEEPGSDALHRGEAVARGLPVTELRWDEAGLDIDGPADLDRLWRSPRPSQTKDYLRAIGRGPAAAAPP